MHDDVRLHGTQSEVVNDRSHSDTLFTSTVWEELTASLGSELAMSTAFQPVTVRMKGPECLGISSFLHGMITKGSALVLNLLATMHGRSHFRILLSC